MDGLKFFKVAFIRKTCLAEIQVQAKNKKQAESKAYEKLYKGDTDYDLTEITEIDKEDFSETETDYSSEGI